MECCKNENLFTNPKDLTVAPINPDTVIWGHTISDLQSNVFAGNGKIVGSLNRVSSGALAADWGEGYFLALQFGGPAFDKALDILVGLEPSVSSGLVNVIKDPDRNGIFKVTNQIQNFKIVINYGSHVETYLYDLSKLEFNANDGPDYGAPI